MRPDNLKTRIFLDSGDPAETRDIKALLGFLDGQITNPTLVANNPHAKERFERGEKFSAEEIIAFYKQVVQEIAGTIPDGSVSIEVYADKSTSGETMLAQGREMFEWIPNAHIKYPTTTEGLRAAELSIKQAMRVNMTLCFTQEQAGAVYAATQGAKPGEVFVSPFIGRLDDIGQNGMDLIKNISQMYKSSDGHVEVLAASVRNQDHFMRSLAYGADIITAPFSVLKEWAEAGMPLPGAEIEQDAGSLRAITYQDLNLDKPWAEYDISHELTSKGIDRFAHDWNGLIG